MKIRTKKIKYWTQLTIMHMFVTWWGHHHYGDCNNLDSYIYVPMSLFFYISIFFFSHMPYPFVFPPFCSVSTLLSNWSLQWWCSYCKVELRSVGELSEVKSWSPQCFKKNTWKTKVTKRIWEFQNFLKLLVPLKTLIVHIVSDTFL